MEKQNNYPVSMLCDRETTNLAKSQKGFLTFIIRPAFELVTKILPRLQFAVDMVDTNLKKWEAEEDKFEKLKESGNNIEDTVERKYQSSASMQGANQLNLMQL